MVSRSYSLGLRKLQSQYMEGNTPPAHKSCKRTMSCMCALKVCSCCVPVVICISQQQCAAALLWLSKHMAALMFSSTLLHSEGIAQNFPSMLCSVQNQCACLACHGDCATYNHTNVLSLGHVGMPSMLMDLDHVKISPLQPYRQPICMLDMEQSSDLLCNSQSS